MSEDGDKDKERARPESKRSSRPANAAGRRERRASARSSGTGAETGKRGAPKGKGGSSSEEVSKPAGKNRPTPKQNRTETERQPLFSRLVRFLREVWAELRKVIWPTRKQMITYTIVVLLFVAFMIALVYALDFVFLEGVDVVFGN